MCLSIFCSNLKEKYLLVIREIVQGGNSIVKILEEKVLKLEVKECLLTVYRVKISVGIN